MEDKRDKEINEKLTAALGCVSRAMTLLGETDIRMVTDKGWVSAMNAHCDLQVALRRILRTLSDRGVDVKEEFGVDLQVGDSK